MSRDISLLYNEYLDINGVKAAGAWCCQTNAIFCDDVEVREEIYLCCTISTFTFLGLKRPRRGAVQLMLSLVTTLKKEQYIPLLHNEYHHIPGVKTVEAWSSPTNANFSDDVEGRAEIYLCCTMSNLIFFC
jgi:hypothetical protein